MNPWLSKMIAALKPLRFKAVPRGGVVSLFTGNRDRSGRSNWMPGDRWNQDASRRAVETQLNVGSLRSIGVLGRDCSYDSGAPASRVLHTPFRETRLRHIAVDPAVWTLSLGSKVLSQTYSLQC